MSSIQTNLETINRDIAAAAVSCKRDPDHIQLIAVSKRKSIDAIKDAIESGAEHFGENYIQEAVEKIKSIGQSAACWHFIGHLQSNKAKIAVQYFDFIHTVDSIKLAKEIDKQARKNNKVQNILVQINISQEASKSGTTHESAKELIQQICTLENVSLKGLMGMPPYFADPEEARPYFKQLFDMKQQIQISGIQGLDHLSMGMSNDFKVAIEEGSTMVRVGTSIFGARE